VTRVTHRWPTASPLALVVPSAAMMRRDVLLVVLCVSSAACEQSKNAYDPKARVDGGPVKVVGAFPDRFDCKGFLPDVATVVGGDVEWIVAEFSPQQGTATPCGFTLRADESKFWQFSIDCRPVAESEIDLVLKTKGTDVNTKMVPLGRKAVDHDRARLIFLDDDTSCAVWVVAPDEAARLALATSIMTKLNNDNAPRYPRGVPTNGR
jgi:hypothetical protein